MIEEAIPFKYLVTKEQSWAQAKQIVKIVGLIFSGTHFAGGCNWFCFNKYPWLNMVLI